MAIKRYLLKPGITQWYVPDDWNNADNSIELIGAGGVGGDATISNGGGGGGGAYSKCTNVTLTPGSIIYIQIGSSQYGQTPVDTWFNKVSNTAPINISQGGLAKCGGNGTSGAGAVTGGTGGQAAQCIGNVVFSGGNGGGGGGSATIIGGGGGGAGWSLGIGKNGGAGDSTNAGADSGGGGGGAGGALSTAGGVGTTTAGLGGFGPLGTGRPDYITYNEPSQGAGGRGGDVTRSAESGASFFSATANSGTWKSFGFGPGGGGGGVGDVGGGFCRGADFGGGAGGGPLDGEIYPIAAGDGAIFITFSGKSFPKNNLVIV